MIRLSDLETVMRPQFVWDRNSQKYFQVSEEFEGNKELARTIFVGLSDMFGFEATDVMNHLDMGYDSYRHKLMQFRENYKEGLRRQTAGTLNNFDDSTKKMYIKTCICLNAIKTATRKNPYLKMEEYINI